MEDYSGRVSLEYDLKCSLSYFCTRSFVYYFFGLLAKGFGFFFIKMLTLMAVWRQEGWARHWSPCYSSTVTCNVLVISLEKQHEAHLDLVWLIWTFHIVKHLHKKGVSFSVVTNILLTKCGFAVVYPLEGPVCFSSHTRHRLNGVK